MARNGRTIEVRNADGNLIVSLRVYDESQPSAGNGAKPPATRNNSRPASNAAKSQTQSHDGNGERDGDAITDAQKRYLFRILADQGLDGDRALAFVKERLGVEVLTNVTKREASSLIDELLGSATTE